MKTTTPEKNLHVSPYACQGTEASRAMFLKNLGRTSNTTRQTRGETCAFDVECLHYHLRQTFFPQLQCKQEHSSQKGTRTRSNKQTSFVQKLWQIPWILHISYIYILQMSNVKIFESQPSFRSVVPHLQPVETSGQIPFGQMPGGPVPGGSGGAKIEENKGPDFHQASCDMY